MANKNHSSITLDSLTDLINKNHDTPQSCYSELEATVNGKIDQITESIGSRINELFLAVDVKFKTVEHNLYTTNTNVDEITRETVADDIMVYGIPLIADESVLLLTIFSIIYKSIGLQWDMRILRQIFRLPGTSKERPIVVKFLSQLLEKEFLLALKSFGLLTLRHLGFNSDANIYVNHCLIKADRPIFKQARLLLKSKQIVAAFIMRGSIFIKKN